MNRPRKKKNKIKILTGVTMIAIIFATAGIVLQHTKQARTLKVAKTDDVSNTVIPEPAAANENLGTSPTSQPVLQTQTQQTTSTTQPPVASISTTEINGSVTGLFVQHEGTSWPNPQTTAYIGINVSNPSQTSRVEWYDVTNGNLLANTQTTPSVGDLYQYDWPIGSLPAGTYRWVARVYDNDGNYQLVQNNNGDSFLDMKVKSN